MYPDLESLDDLLAVAETGHFGKAARMRHVSVATLSRRLAKLERQFGRTLVIRGPGGTEGLTAAGIDLVARARPLLREASRLLMARPAGGRGVRLGVCGVASDHMSARDWEVFVAALTAATGISVRLVDVPFENCDDVVSDDGCDLIVQQVEPNVAGVTEQVLTDAGRIVVMPRSHALAGQAAVSVSDIEGLPVLYPAGSTSGWIAPWVLADVAPSSKRRLVGVRSTSFSAACRALEPSGAVAVTSETVRHRVDPLWAVAQLVDAPPLTVRLHMARGRRRAGVLDVASALASIPPAPPGG